VNQALWQHCSERLQSELTTQHFNTWIKPLQAELRDETLILYAPNSYVIDWVKDKYLTMISHFLGEIATDKGIKPPNVGFEVGRIAKADDAPVANQKTRGAVSRAPAPTASGVQPRRPTPWDNDGTVLPIFECNIHPEYTFDNFVEGKSNQLARAAALQVAENPGGVYNPLFVYGGTGLGKTHLLHAIGNGIIAHKKDAKVFYMRAERFVQDMVNAIKNNTMNEFKRYYRSVDALLIDDIHFFANKRARKKSSFIP